MAAGKRITQEQEEQIVLYAAEDLSVRDIAALVGLSNTSVTRVMKKHGIAASEDRKRQTAAAKAARIRRAEQQRLKLAERLLEDAFRTRERLWEEHSYYERTPNGMVKITQPLPSIKDQRDGYQALSLQVATHDRLMDGVNMDESHEKKSVFGDLRQQLTKYFDEKGNTEEQEDESDGTA